MPTTAAMAGGQRVQPVAPRTPPVPTIRFQNEEPAPVAPPRLALPSPDQLGIRPANPVSVPAVALDWNHTHARLQELGALGFHLDRMAQGSVRVTFYLPAGAGGRTRLIEAEAADDAQAVALALRQADAWNRGTR